MTEEDYEEIHSSTMLSKIADSLDQINESLIRIADKFDPQELT